VQLFTEASVVAQGGKHLSLPFLSLALYIHAQLSVVGCWLLAGVGTRLCKALQMGQLG